MVQYILVDTDVLIDAGRAVEVAVVQLETAAQKSTLAVSIITQMELVVGCRNRTELQIIERFLERFEIIKLSEAISDKAIDLLCNYRLSHGLLIADALIAATTIVIDVPLLSKNQRDTALFKVLISCLIFEFKALVIHLIGKKSHQTRIA